MDLSPPRVGLVIRYAYLWSREALRGADEASKDRPCAVLLVAETRRGDVVATVLPVTHSPPRGEEVIEIPSATKHRLGLDGERSWIVLTEVNQFVWPGPDVRVVPGEDTIAYGELPADFYREVRDRWLALYDRGGVIPVTRSE